jgi:hypothetical protein
MTGAKRPQRGPIGGAVDAFYNEFSDHLDKTRVNADGRRPLHVDAQAFAQFLGLGIEVEQDFHVVGDKANRHDNQLPQIPCGVEFFNAVAHVRL